MWSQLDLLKAGDRRDPIRLEGVESQFEELSKLVGQPSKRSARGHTRRRGCADLERALPQHPQQGLQLGDHLHFEVETEWHDA